MPSAIARRYIRTHHSRIAAVRKNPAISHQPPSFSGGKMDRPCLAEGGSSDRNGSSLMNRITFQSTCASMFRPMISNATKPHTMDRIADGADVGRAHLRLAQPAEPDRVARPQHAAAEPFGTGGPASNGASSSIEVNSVW